LVSSKPSPSWLISSLVSHRGVLSITNLPGMHP
jgi:hypothetical protein